MKPEAGRSGRNSLTLSLNQAFWRFCYVETMNTILNAALIIGGVWIGDQVFNQGYITAAVLQMAYHQFG